MRIRPRLGDIKPMKMFATDLFFKWWQKLLLLAAVLFMFLLAVDEVLTK